MFISLLTRILMVLTLLAFAGAFALLEERQGTFRNALIGVSLTLLTVTIAKLLVEGSAFDDRAFHRTRPDGERKTLRRLNLVMAGIVLAIAIMPAVRCGIYHLGWQAAAWAALIALLPIASLTLAVATGVNLSLQGKGSLRKVVPILLMGPIGLTLMAMVVPYLWKWVSPPLVGEGFYVPMWMNTTTWGAMLGAGGYGVSWWLASRWRQGKTALLFAGLTGILIQIQGIKIPLVATPDLPVAAVNIERLPSPGNTRPIEESVRPGFRESWGMDDPKVEASLRAVNLPEDEFVSCVLMVAPSNRNYFPPTTVLDAYGRADLIRQGGSSRLASRFDSLLDSMSSRLPGSPTLENRMNQLPEYWSSAQDWRGEAQLLTSTWKVEGMLSRVDSVGSFPVRARTTAPLHGGGRILTWDLQHTEHEISLGFRLIQPDLPMDPQPKPGIHAGRGYSSCDSIFIWGFMVHESRTKARVVLQQRVYEEYRQCAFGSRWSDLWVNLRSSRSPEGWTDEEVLRSKVHLFISRPVGYVDASLPPP